MSQNLVQTPFVSAEFAENPEMRCPCILVLDTSESMADHDAIGELNSGLVSFKDDLEQDPMARKRVELAIVTFGGQVRVIQEFTSVDRYYPPRLTAGGGTPAGEALRTGVQLVNERKAVLKQNGIPYYRPWIFFMTDGKPTDEWSGAAAAIHEGEAKKAFSFFACGVKGANMATLSLIAPPTRPPLRLIETRFSELFGWLSSSLSAVSNSASASDVIALPPPTGWGSV